MGTLALSSIQARIRLAVLSAILMLAVPALGVAQPTARVSTSLPEVAALRLILDSVGPRYRVAVGTHFMGRSEGGAAQLPARIGYRIVDSLRQHREIREAQLTNLLTCAGEGTSRQCRMGRDDIFFEVSRPAISGDTAVVYVRMRQPSAFHRSGTFSTLVQYQLRKVGTEWHLVRRRVAAMS